MTLAVVTSSFQKPEGNKDGWMDGRMDGRTDGWMGGWMDEGGK